MRYALLSLFVIASVITNAQVRLKLNYNKNWELTSPDSAAFIRVCIYDTTHSFFAGPIADLYPSGKPQMEGTYIGQKKEGYFKFYFENGRVHSVGSFENDLRVGTWKYFYEDGSEKFALTFLSGQEDPKVLFLKGESGQLLVEAGFGKWKEEVEIGNERIIVTGEFKNSMRHGTWRFYNPRTSRSRVEIFDNGKFVDGYNEDQGRKYYDTFKPQRQFEVPTKFVVTESFVARPSIDFSVYPALNVISSKGIRIYRRPRYKIYTSSDTTHEPVFVDVPAATKVKYGYYGDPLYYINNKLKYPEQAKHQGIEGNVVIEYMVNEDGSLSDLKLLKTIGGGCDEEAMRVMEGYLKVVEWDPAMKDGKPVRQRMVQSVKFSLGDDLRNGNDEDRIYTFVDTPAEPPGGYQRFTNYMTLHQHFPTEAAKKNIGRSHVTVEFVVRKDGSLTDIKLERPSAWGFGDEAMRLMRSYAGKFKWTPAVQGGKNVNQRVVVPINFKASFN